MRIIRAQINWPRKEYSSRILLKDFFNNIGRVRKPSSGRRKVGYRRLSPIDERAGLGLLTEPTSAPQPWVPEPRKLPHTRRSKYRDRLNWVEAGHWPIPPAFATLHASGSRGRERTPLPDRSMRPFGRYRSLPRWRNM
jgi:hypothetical protein